MLLRIRWFFMGFIASLAGVAYARVKLRQARRRLAPAALANRGKHAAAAMLDRTADRIDPSPPAL